KQQMREEGPLSKSELLRRPVEHGDADDVGRQQIARELHALPGKPQHMRERVRESRLADARNILDEQVAAGEQTGEAEPHLMRLAQNDRPERRERALERSDLGLHSSRPRTRASWDSRPARARASSASRSRSVATTSAGAWLAKLSFASLVRTFAKSCCVRAMCLPSRSASAAASIRPAIGTSTVSSPISAVADCGASVAASSSAMRSIPARRSRYPRWRSIFSRSSADAPFSSTGTPRLAGIFISPLIWRTPARIDLITAIS